LVVSRLKAFEGAVAVVPEEFDGWFLSPEFPTFSCIRSELDHEYLSHICRWPEFWRLLASASKGIGARRERVHVDQLLRLGLRVPSIEQQHPVVCRLNKARLQVSKILCEQAEARRLDEAFIDAAIWSVIERGLRSGWKTRRLGQVAEINPPGDRLEPDELVSFVPMAAVSKLTGAIERPELRTAGAIGTGYKQFKVDDVIFARITPCMQNGKTAIFEGDTTYGYGSTEFHVVRSGPTVNPKWIHSYLRTREFRAAAARHFTGTAGQQRVPADFLRTVDIPIPPNQTDVVAFIDGIRRTSSIVKIKRDETAALAVALGLSVLNKSFAGLISQ
jgi:type I restriction enzyme S subunit